MTPFGAPGPIEPPPPVQIPLIGIVATGISVVEGATINMTVNRTVILNGAVSYNYAFTSTAGSADFTGAISGTRTMVAGQVTDTVTVATVERSGAQGSRTITCILSNVVDGMIDPVRPQASILLEDFVAPVSVEWHKALPYRSGHPWARGPSYFNDWTIYEDNCGYIDAFNGSNYGSNQDNIATWEAMAGGPKGNPSSFLNTSQMNWTNNNRFPKPWKEHTANRCWCCFTCSTVPKLASTMASTAAHNKVWTDINAGIFDQYYKDFGARIRINCAARGISMSWLLLRFNHENDQSNTWQVFSDAKPNYKSAMERTHDLVREGADFHLRCMFCPGPNKKAANDTASKGALESWCPTNIDAISMSFHTTATNRSAYLNKIDGNSQYYGLDGDVKRLCVANGWKMAFGEWSPVSDKCTIADDVYRWFYDEFLLPNRNMIIGDMVFSPKTFDPNGGVGNTPEGFANWAEGVDVFKARWKGKSVTQPSYVNPNWPAGISIPAFGSDPVPVNTVQPVITGIAASGQVLSCSNGSWSNTPTSYTYQWIRDGRNYIPANSTSTNYTLVTGDIGKKISCRVTAYNGRGGQARSAAQTATVTA